jgi:hypothetical protein
MAAGARTKKQSGSARGALPNAVTLALGKNLRRFRVEAGLTELELAFDAEVERSRISKIDRLRESRQRRGAICARPGSGST